MAKELTIKGLQKEQKDLTAAFHSAREAFDEAQAAYKTAKDNLVEFSNSYGRVLQVLDSTE